MDGRVEVSPAPSRLAREAQGSRANRIRRQWLWLLSPKGK